MFKIAELAKKFEDREIQELVGVVWSKEEGGQAKLQAADRPYQVGT